MKVFLSHARKDEDLARELARQLQSAGFTVWLPEEQIAPNDNWAKKTGKALDDSELMVILLTPRAMDSDSLRHNVEYALGSRRFEHRVFTVLVGRAMKAGKDVPWILLELPHEHVRVAHEFGEVAGKIQELCVTLT